MELGYDFHQPHFNGGGTLKARGLEAGALSSLAMVAPSKRLSPGTSRLSRVVIISHWYTILLIGRAISLVVVVGLIALSIGIAR